jgi:hypothetical protein
MVLTVFGGIRSLPQDFAKFFSGGCHVTLYSAGDANGRQFRRSGGGAVKQTLASQELENRHEQCDAASGFHFDEERTITVRLETHRAAKDRIRCLLTTDLSGL